jgi:hypothetical protein
MREKQRGKIPKVLEQRLLIDDDDRVLLKTIEELSPRDTGRFMLAPSVFEDYIPTLYKISQTLGQPKEKVWERMNKIAKIWELPNAEDLPTNEGFFDKEDALVNALVNQHKLRWDEKFGDYRVPKMHMFSAEMGTGTLYTNNDAFKGEQLIRQSLGFDEVMTSYHMQGGIMPEMIQMFGKLKNKRAIMTGMNKTGKEYDPEELNLIKTEMTKLNEALERDKPLDEKLIKKVEEHIINTIDSPEEAAESAAYELVPLLQDLDEKTPIHLYFSYNDDSNKSEIEDQHIAILRNLHGRMAKATRDLPKFKSQLEEIVQEQKHISIEADISNTFYSYLMELKDNLEEEESFFEKGKGFKKYISDFFNKESEDYKKLKNSTYENLKNKLEKEPVNFDYIFDMNIDSYLMNNTTFKKVSDRKLSLENKKYKLESKAKDLNDKINESKGFQNSLLVEQMEGHSWFTKKIAIKPTQAKALETIKKDIYKDLYNEILIPKIKELTGKDLNIKLHTDDIITVEVPDPQYIIENNNDPERPIGTLMTSFPRTNAQRSNEPLKESFVELIGFHEGEISEAIKKGKIRPEQLKDFNKRNFAFSDIYFTGYGADGYKHQKKFSIDPDTEIGKYAGDDHIADYIKLPTRHDTSKLGELMVKGNKGTWQGKRMAKNGNTTGPVLYIEYPDQSTEQIFWDDDYLARVGHEYGDKFDKINESIKSYEEKLSKARKESTQRKYKEQIEKLEEKKQEILSEIKPKINRVFLENDIHLEAYSTPGRTSLIDGLLSSQLVALQSYGFSGIDYAIMTEAMNGEQAWRSYDSSREGFGVDAITHMNNMNTLEAKLKEEKVTKAQIDEMRKLAQEEYLHSIPGFKPEGQKAQFSSTLVPINREMMDNGVLLYCGAGNHWMASGGGKSEDEANVMQTLLGDKYKEQGLLVRGQSSSGQSFGFDSVTLPGDIKAALTHKMWHGATEISQIAKQLVRIRDPAVYVYTADRHHPGSIAEKGKMGVLDVGKQPTIVYRKMIGKSASIRGTMVAGYDPSGNNGMLATRYFTDEVIEGVSGWNYKKPLLIKARSLIEEGTKDNSIFREQKKIDYALEKQKRKDIDGLMEKYSRK